MIDTEPTIEVKIIELERAGWKRRRIGQWEDPKGNLFIGPNGAWKYMKGIK